MQESIISYLPDNHPWRSSIFWFDTVDSTNTHAKELAAAGAPHGTVLIADRQTGGRGRLGRSFQSPAGMGIYLSLILRPNCPAAQLMHLTCAVAVSTCDAVEQTLNFRPSIKWINDLVAQRRKLAGILTELSVNPRTGFVDYAVVGIGINCQQCEDDFPAELRSIAGSAAMVTGKPVDRTRLAAAMIQELERMSRKLLTEKVQTMERYRGECVTIGAEVDVIRNDLHRRGTALDIDNEGGLLVSFTDGSTETVQSGEVSVRGLFGYV